MTNISLNNNIFGERALFMLLYYLNLKEQNDMKRVTAIGGIFFKSNDPEKMREWYKTHLGFEVSPYGTRFNWQQTDNPEKEGYTLWSPFAEDTQYFAPSSKDFMINFRVDDLEALVTALKEEGVTVLDDIEAYDYGKFVHILDLEGNKLELWEPA
jgi:predicted enzyme related to lactoylglutathione lyase